MAKTNHSETPQEGPSNAQIIDDKPYWGKPINFEVPHDPTDYEIQLAKDIVRLDHRSVWTLGSTTERGEVYRLIGNVISFLQQRKPRTARALLDYAESVYFQHIQAKNRLKYLSGMLFGIVIILGLGFLLSWLFSSPSAVIPSTMLPTILLFAGMGSITSVLTRLSAIDLRDQTSHWMIIISGMARPVTGLFFALAVYLVLSLRIVDFHIGAGTDPTPPAMFLIAAFMSGFSERFAHDILAKVGGAVSASASPSEAQPPSELPRGASAPKTEDESPVGK
jgi:hypothetical protein